NKTEIGNYTILHHTDLSPEFEARFSAMDKSLQKSELYDADFKVKICLNDGSLYPELMEKLRGPAFGWGFHNIAVFRGAFDYQDNAVTLNGYKWNLEHLIAHEVTHCLQFNAFGFFGANPMAGHPHWKWEGYPEYVARKNDEQSLHESIKRLKQAQKESPDSWGVFFDDGTISPKTYYEDWLLAWYCLEIKSMSYRELLSCELSKEEAQQEMETWYQGL
ncbi:MAG: hypothetical protein AAF740_10785, partial [Bacteroidota bacterium]